MEQEPIKEMAGPSSSEACTDPYLRCAFNGAALTALGISHSALLAHSPQGCEYLINNAFASQECDYMETMTLCTKLCVDEIVHGGEDILARTIREVKDLPISALFVLSACGPEIVGDDIVGVCEACSRKLISSLSLLNPLDSADRSTMELTLHWIQFSKHW